ncbi:DNA binding methylated-DNA--cysteine S-methyltransferase [Fomitopsis schrenkii]|uniref:DNA binding methylated-DNA--cysteine S-methyltransferase n=1 Tax=Fomitopsis schrenkii TaxID=2126942 RepID=S8DTV1_FOMSC|nr:DNA binding methylated-DNA--cysteine S-methyltransferase [Fomitopsis schrenkii]
MDSAQFHAAVYHVVRQIPPHHVTTYGHIAKLIGMPRHSRHVGQALKFVSSDVQPPIPWYRVISSSGTISSRGPGTSGADNQRQELEAEGTEVSVGRTGDMRVDLKRYGWFPAPGTVDTGVDLHESEDDFGEATDDTLDARDGEHGSF